jgi:serine protease Do
MDQIILLDTTERYLKGEMNAEERAQFDNLRKSNPEIDQFVVEHHFFMEEMARYSDRKKFKANLYDTHHTLQENAEIKELKPSGKGKLVYLWSRYRRVVAVAATIAGVTALMFSSLVMLFTPKAPTEEIEVLKREVSRLKSQSSLQNKEINDVKKKIEPGVDIKFGGSSFLIDGKGYLITSAHLISNASKVFVQNNKGQDFRAEIILTDPEKDIAILKIDDTDFHPRSSLPYGIRKASTDLAEPIFTLGYPKDEIVYGEGYLSSKTGLKGDTLSFQISLAANPGNSGGPVLNKNGEVIGILNARQTTAEGVVFAVKAQNILRAIDQIRKDTTYQHIRIPSSSGLRGMDRVQQVKKIEDCVYMVKVVVN